MLVFFSIHLFFILRLQVFPLKSTATFEVFWPFYGPFTAPHGPEFFTAPRLFLRPLLSKGAVTTATWQPWLYQPLKYVYSSARSHIIETAKTTFITILHVLSAGKRVALRSENDKRKEIKYLFIYKIFK
jgi:hypothetical protein